MRSTRWSKEHRGRYPLLPKRAPNVTAVTDLGRAEWHVLHFLLPMGGEEARGKKLASLGTQVMSSSDWVLEA